MLYDKGVDKGLCRFWNETFIEGLFMLFFAQSGETRTPTGVPVQSALRIASLGKAEAAFDARIDLGENWCDQRTYEYEWAERPRITKLLDSDHDTRASVLPREH